MKNLKRKRKTVSVMAAAVMTAALLGGQVSPVWAGYEKQVEKRSLFPDNVTIETPTELKNVSLPESDYGTFSWYDDSYVPEKRVERCKVKLKPFSSVDLSGYSGWDEEKGVLIGKVTVVTLSYESDGSEETATEETSENTVTNQTEDSKETETSAEGAEASEGTTSAGGTETSEGITSEKKISEETSAAGETKASEETAGTTESTEKTTLPGIMPETVTEETTGQQTESTQTTETAQQPEGTQSDEKNLTGGNTERAEDVLLGTAKETTTEETTGQAETSSQGEKTQTDVSEQSEALQNQPELPGGELLVPLAPSSVPEQARPVTEETTQATSSETDSSAAEQKGTGETSAAEQKGTDVSYDAEENLTAAEQAERGAQNHTSGGITVSGTNLPWYVQFQVTDGSEYQFSNEEGAAVFSSYEFRLWDLKNQTEYEVPDGEYISVMIPVKEGYSYTIEHILDNGAVETIVPSVSGGTMVFSTHSFSPFGIAGTKMLVGEEIAEKTYTGATATPTPSLTPTPSVTGAANSGSTGTSGSGTSGTGTTGTGTTAKTTGTSSTGSTGTGISGTASTGAGISGTGTGTTSAGTGTSGTGTSTGSTSAAAGSSTGSVNQTTTGAVKTADETPVTFFALLAAASAVLAGFTAAFRRKRS